MKYPRHKNNYLYEGLDYSNSHSMMLWESAGFKLKEAALSADQIQQIFQTVEKNATDAGSNRTMLGKGKDAAAAVNKAWEDLKTKVQNSGPIKNYDDAYDATVAKIEAGLGGPDNAINKVIQKYRKFAKEHPVAQGLIYSALIAAAGISGAGLGGAAVLGLLKMTDKLLQGEKFSSAAYSGAKTGALAYGASKLGDLIKGKPEGGALDPNDPDVAEFNRDIADTKGLANDQAFQDRLLNKFPPDKGFTVAAGEGGKGLQVLDTAGNKVWQGDIPLKTMDTQTFADLTNAGKMATPGVSSGSVSSDAIAGVSDKAASAAGQVVKGAGAEMFKGLASDSMADATIKRIADSIAAGQLSTSDLQHLQASQGFITNALSNADPAREAALTAHYNVLDKMLRAANDIPVNSSIQRTGRALSEGQVYMIFNRISAQQQLTEGPMDFIKGAAAKGMDKLKTVGKNLTTKVTADKLNSAWQKAGSPMDSEELKQFLLSYDGIEAPVVDKVFTDLKIAAAPAAQATPSGYAEVKKLISTLNTKDRQRMIQYLTKQIGTA